MSSNFPRKMSVKGILWQILKGFAVDTKQGGFPVVQVFKGIALGTNTAIRAAVTLTTAVQKITSSINNPDVPRALLVKGNQSDVLGTVKIVGKNYAGESLVEEIVASGSGAISGNKAFKSVDYILFPARTATGQTISVGTTNKLGLCRPISESAVDDLTVDGTSENPAALDTTYHTVTPTTAPNGSRKFVVYYRTDIF